MNNSIYCLKYKQIPFYIGSTINPIIDDNKSSRERNHKSDCFNEKRKNYTAEKYQYIRSLGITPDTYYDEIQFEVLYENVPDDYRKVMENLVIDLYKDHYETKNSYNVIFSQTKQEKAEYDREYRLKNLEKRRQQCKEWRAVNREESNKRMVRPEECNKCHKMISHCNMKRHQKSSNCV